MISRCPGFEVAQMKGNRRLFIEEVTKEFFALFPLGDDEDQEEKEKVSISALEMSQTLTTVLLQQISDYFYNHTGARGVKGKSPTKEMKACIESVLKSVEPKHKKKLADYQAYSSMLWFVKLREPIMALWALKKGATRHQFISFMNTELKARLAKESPLVRRQVLEYIEECQ